MRSNNMKSTKVVALLDYPLLVFLKANRKNLQAYGIAVVAVHSEVFRVSYFPQGMKVLF
jgi:hypothetical protein